MHRIQGIQTRYGRRVEEYDKRVAHAIRPAARKALHVVREATSYKSVKKEFLRSQIHSDMQSQVVSFRNVSHNREEHTSQLFRKHGEPNEAILRVQGQTEELMTTLSMDNFEEISESDRQAVIRAQEMAAFFFKVKCRMQRKPSILKNEETRLTNEVTEQSTNKISGGNSLHHSATHPAPPEKKFANFYRRQTE